MQPRIVFHIGGPEFHPVKDQAAAVASWLGPRYRYEFLDGVDAFGVLEECDLLVLMGLHWTGMAPPPLAMEYRPMLEPHLRAFERYIGSGRPLLVHHGAIASYDDCPRFGQLVGVTWIWGRSSHSPIGQHRVTIRPSGHPIVTTVDDFEIFDELYYNLEIDAGLPVAIHAAARWDGADHPMVVTAEGGRTPGAGRMVYLANGHDMRAMQSDGLRRLWVNSTQWLLDERW